MRPFPGARHRRGPEPAAKKVKRTHRCAHHKKSVGPPDAQAGLRRRFSRTKGIQASGVAGVTAAAGISSLFVKRHLTLLRLLAERALRRFSSMGLSNARRRRISSRMPSVSSLVFRRFRARSIGSPLRTVTERMILVWLLNFVRERDGRIAQHFRAVKNFIAKESTKARQTQKNAGKDTTEASSPSSDSAQQLSPAMRSSRKPGPFRCTPALAP